MKRGAGRKRRLLALVASLAILLAAVLATQAPTIRLGGEAYLFGYPLVIVDATRATAGQTLGPENRLHRVRRFPSAGFRDVVRPNMDTLYTTAFIDMARGPWVFEMGPNNQRFEVMPFMDAWTNVFASPGSRGTGTGGTRLLLAASNWQGTVPDGLTLVRAPTRLVWLIGRTQTRGAADYPLVHHLQDGITLRSLQAWQSGRPDAELAWQAASDRPPPPIRQMQRMDTATFFTRLAELLEDNPPAAADAPMLARLAQVGVRPGQPPQWTMADRWSLALGRWIADRLVQGQLRKPRNPVQGWLMPPANLGNYGTDYATRAAVAMVGLGANLPADAVYPSTGMDSQGRTLDGTHRYRLHFAAGALPPVQAFWSVSAYGADDFFIDNPLQRHALGSDSPLQYNPDGSLDLWIQAVAPAPPRQANWLPVRAGQPFGLTARLYWPQPAALQGRWNMPAVERID